MKGLVQKDFIALKKYLFQFLVVGGLFSLLGFSMKSPTYVAVMFCLFGTMSILTSMTYDEKAGWNKIVFSLPLEKKEVVKAKYITWMILTLLTFMAAIIIGSGLAYFFQEDIKDFWMSLLLTTSIYVILFSICIPFAYQKGVEKARIIMIVTFSVPFAIITLLSLSKKTTGFFNKQTLELLIQNSVFLVPVLAVGAVVLSYYASVFVVKKKEW